MAFDSQLRAVIQCDWETNDGSWGCTRTEEYTADAEGVSLTTFLEDAKEHFLDRGWQFGMPSFRCPHCKGRRTDVRDEEDAEVTIAGCQTP